MRSKAAASIQAAFLELKVSGALITGEMRMYVGVSGTGRAWSRQLRDRLTGMGLSPTCHHADAMRTLRQCVSTVISLFFRHVFVGNGDTVSVFCAVRTATYGVDSASFRRARHEWFRFHGVVFVPRWRVGGRGRDARRVAAVAWRRRRRRTRRFALAGAFVVVFAHHRGAHLSCHRLATFHRYTTYASGARSDRGGRHGRERRRRPIDGGRRSRSSKRASRATADRPPTGRCWRRPTKFSGAPRMRAPRARQDPEHPRLACADGRLDPERGRQRLSEGNAAAHPRPPARAPASVADLERRANAAPRDAQTWLALADAQRAQRDLGGARASLEKVVALKAMTAQSWADYADTLASLNGGSLGGAAGNAIDSALALDATNTKALWLKASQAHEQRASARRSPGGRSYARYCRRTPPTRASSTATSPRTPSWPGGQRPARRARRRLQPPLPRRVRQRSRNCPAPCRSTVA